MPWSTPTIEDLRALNRSYITGQLKSVPLIPNSVLRVMADSNSGLGYLVLLYIDWLANQLLPDRAEDEWLDRHGQIWLKNADGTKGRKLSQYASGTALAAGIEGVPIPFQSIFTATIDTSLGTTVSFQSTAAAVITAGQAIVPLIAMDPGSDSNLQEGTALSPSAAISGLSSLVVNLISGGSDEETDDELRARVKERIQKPPMGGDADDYVEWILEVSGVTRAWCSPLEMGIGTVTVRFMMDDLRATSDPTTNGFPTDFDVAKVQTFLNTVRPVTTKDIFIEAPVPFQIDCTISNLDGIASNDSILESIQEMLALKAAPAFSINGITQPAQTIYKVWVSDAILNTAGVISFDLDMADEVPMPSSGYMAVIGTVTFQ